MTFRPTLPRASHKLPPSSRAWLARQYRDPYVKARLSQPVNYRSRSAFKLVELDSRWGFLSCKDVTTVVDLGAAPGGWSQVIAGKLGWAEQDLLPLRSAKASDLAPSGYGLKKKCKRKQAETGWSVPSTLKGEDDGGEVTQQEDEYAKLLEEDLVPPPMPAGRGTIIAVDLLRIEPIRGVRTLQMDFLSSTAETYINALLANLPGADGKADVILSDMAANFTGNATADVESSLRICESVYQFAQRHLRTAESLGRRLGGALVIKHFAYPAADIFRKNVLEPNFHTVAFDKPPSSRSESREGYWVCLGWKGQSTSPMLSASASQQNRD